MNPIPYLLCFAAGIAINEIYHRKQKVAEYKAYNKGYKQAQKETAVKNAAKYTQQQPKYKTYELPKPKIEHEQPRTIKTVDEAFMENLRANKCAVIKLR